jgi:acyl-CoA thioester hydrolase
MDSFSQSITVGPEHLDQNQHVNNLVYLQWTLDISKEHWLSLVSKEILNSYYWVVRSHHIEYKKQALLGDELTIKTYVTNYKGPFSERIVKVLNTEDEVIAEVKSNWCLLDQALQKPIRVPEEIRKLFGVF